MDQITFKHMQKENEWKKEKALLEQKIQLHLLQIQELKAREENYKKFNDSIFVAYNSLTSDSTKGNSKIFKEIQMSLDSFSRDLIESKQKTSESIENENRNLRNQILQLDQKYKENINKLEKEILLLEAKNDTLQRELMQSNAKERSKSECVTRDSQPELVEQVKQLKLALQQQEQLRNEEKEAFEIRYQERAIQLEQQYQEKIAYHKEREKQELIEKQSKNILDETIRNSTLIHKASKSNLLNYESQQDNKENKNSNYQPFMSFKSSPMAQSKTPEPTTQKNIGTFSGCIVTAKSRGTVSVIKKNKLNILQRSKTSHNHKLKQPLEQVNQNSLTQRGESFRSPTHTRGSDETKNNDIKRKNDLSNSQFNNVNCKNSNVMEVLPQQLMGQSDIYRLFAQESNPKLKLSYLQTEKSHFDSQYYDIENRTPSTKNERSKLKDQLKQISRELKKAKNDITKEEDKEQNTMLKHEIKYMINKLLKAKTKLTDSMVSINTSSVHIRNQSRTIAHQRDNDTYQLYERSLESFTRQLNQAKSIEHYSQVHRNDSSSSKRPSLNQSGQFRNCRGLIQ